MQVTLTQLKDWLQEPENEHLELKEAKSRFDFEVLVKYCAALANEGGGQMILGVSDKLPRRIVGSQAFADLERTKAGLFERLHLRIDVDELRHPDGRVLVFTAPPRPLGKPIQYKGAYWMRVGESLVPMTPDRLKKVFAEDAPDFSAEICPGAVQDDLDPMAIALFRGLWADHSGNEALATLDDAQLLEDAELLGDDGVTYAALILLGTRKALGRRLALAEVIFEYRSHEAHIDYQRRREHREGFFLFRDEIWDTIDLRNDLRFYSDEGFVRSSIPSFNKDAVREAILNAVSHRDYRQEGSIFVRQFPDKIEIVSPGGFPPGITLQNLLWKQEPRNRLIAGTFARCGLIERSGQGANRIFEACVVEGKLPPDFGDSDAYQVSMTLYGAIDPGLVRFLKRVRKQTGSLDTRDLLVIDAVYRGTPIDPRLESQIEPLCEREILERSGDELMLSKDVLREIAEGPRETISEHPAEATPSHHTPPVTVIAESGVRKHRGLPAWSAVALSLVVLVVILALVLRDRFSDSSIQAGRAIILPFVEIPENGTLRSAPPQWASVLLPELVRLEWPEHGDLFSELLSTDTTDRDPKGEAFRALATRLLNGTALKNGSLEKGLAAAPETLMDLAGMRDAEIVLFGTFQRSFEPSAGLTVHLGAQRPGELVARSWEASGTVSELSQIVSRLVAEAVDQPTARKGVVIPEPASEYKSQVEAAEYHLRTLDTTRLRQVGFVSAVLDATEPLMVTDTDGIPDADVVRDRVTAMLNRLPTNDLRVQITAAEVLAVLGREREAEGVMSSVLEQSSDWRQDERVCVLARWLGMRRRWQAAASLYEELWQRQECPSLKRSELGLRLAEAQARAGKRDAALKIVEAVRKLDTVTDSDPRLALVESYAYDLADPPEGRNRNLQLAAAERAEEEARRLGQDFYVASARRRQSQALVFLQRWDDAVAAAEEAAEFYRKHTDPQGLGEALWQLGWTLMWRGQAEDDNALLSDAKQTLLEAARKYREVPNRRAAARVMLDRARIFQYEGDLVTAIRQTEDALANLRAIGGDADGEIAALFNLSAVLSIHGRFSESEEHCQRGFELLAARGGDPVWQPFGYHVYGLLKKYQGDWDAAEDAFTEAVNSGKALNTAATRSTTVLPCLVHRGIVQHAKAEWEEAEKSIAEALSAYRSAPHSDAYASTLVARADIRRDRDELVEAADLYEEAAKIYAQSGYLGGLGRTQLGQAKLRLAEAHLVSPRARTTKLEDALRNATEAVKNLRASSFLLEEIQALGLGARILTELGRLDEARDKIAEGRSIMYEGRLPEGAPWPFELPFRLAEARLRLAEGDVQGSRQTLTVLLADAEVKDPSGQLSFEILLTKAQLELEAGHAPAAQALLDRVRREAEMAGFLLLAHRAGALL